MDESDEQLIESILAIVDGSVRRAAELSDLRQEPEGSFYRLYWLAISDLGASQGCVECECPMTGDRSMVPAFVRRFAAAEPGVVHVKTDAEEEEFESFGYLSFSDEGRLHKLYRKLVLAAEDELAQTEAVFQYVEIEAWVCALTDFGAPADKSIGKRVYGVQLRPGNRHEIKPV
jgi:hypothetical protein